MFIKGITLTQLVLFQPFTVTAPSGDFPVKVLGPPGVPLLAALVFTVGESVLLLEAAEPETVAVAEAAAEASVPDAVAVAVAEAEATREEASWGEIVCVVALWLAPAFAEPLRAI